MLTPTTWEFDEGEDVLGFAVVDAQADRVAVWLVGRTELHRAGSTNAVVTDRSEVGTLNLLTRDRLVLFAPGVSIEAATTGVDLTQVIDSLSTSASELRSACRRQWRSLRLPEAPFDESSKDQPNEQLVVMPADPHELPARAVAWANGLIKAWSFWLAVEAVRHRKATALHGAGKVGDLEDTLGAKAFAALPVELNEMVRDLDA